MENKVIKKVDTGWQFPLLLYTVSVKYNEVRKTSGIAYILLELLQKKEALQGRYIAKILSGFGIPEDLQYMFFNELCSLIDTQLVDSRTNKNSITRRHYPQIKIDDFDLTEKGLMMFRKGAIPTGKEKCKSVTVYYSPVTRRFSLTCQERYNDLDTSFMGEHILDNVPIDTGGMEDYLKSVQTKYGLKQEEVIVSVSIENTEFKAVKSNDIKITISDTGVRFGFETSDEQAFFDKYFSSRTVETALERKNNYKFAEDVGRISLTELAAADQVYVPGNLQEQMLKPTKVYIGRAGRYERPDDKVPRIENEDADRLLDGLDVRAAFALLDSSGCRYYMPVKAEFPCDGFNDTFTMQLLVEKSVDRQASAQLAKDIFDIYLPKEFNEDNGRMILAVSGMLEKAESLRAYVSAQLNGKEHVDDKIRKLLEMISVFAKDAGWRAILSETGNELLEESAKTITLNNVSYKNSSLSPLKKALGMTDDEYIKKFSANIEGTEIEIYETLEKANFRPADILNVVNIIKKYMSDILDNRDIEGDNGLTRSFGVLQSNFRKLNDFLGIRSSSEYTLREDFDRNDFLDTYNTFMSAYGAIERHGAYARNEFRELGAYVEIYKPVRELLVIEKESSSNPDKITREYIDSLILKGNYKNAVCDLFVKLQYDSWKILDIDDWGISVKDLIDRLLYEGIIDENEKDDLHKLRLCRNGLQHPTARQFELKSPEIGRWADVVFAINGVKK